VDVVHSHPYAGHQGICFGQYHRQKPMVFEKEYFHRLIFDHMHTPHRLQADELSKNLPTPIGLQPMIFCNLLHAHRHVTLSSCVPLR
jgi:hypothetical protein